MKEVRKGYVIKYAILECEIYKKGRVMLSSTQY